MPVLTGDILMRASANAGSSGGAMAGSSITSGAMNNVFPDITDAERLSGHEAYRKVFWRNQNVSDPVIAPVVYCAVLPDSITASIGLGFDAAADDNALQGNMTAFTTPALVELASDGADARVVTIWGKDNAGAPTSEDVVLSDATPVLSATVFAAVWAVQVEGTSGTRSVTVKQGSGGALRGTIPPDELCCWLWVANADTKAEGIALPDLGAGQSYGVWIRLEVAPAADPARPDQVTIRIEEA